MDAWLYADEAHESFWRFDDVAPGFQYGRSASGGSEGLVSAPANDDDMIVFSKTPYPVGDVIVVGKRTSGQGWSGGSYDSSWFDWDGYDSDPYSNPPSAPPRPDGWSDCKDRAIDDLAESAANLINRLPTASRQEFGYLIWKDDSGNFHLSSRIDGDNNSLTGLSPSSVPSDFGFSAWNQVVGIIHSHPTERMHPDGTWVTVDPSQGHDMPSVGDWAWPDFFVQQSADATNFRQYLLHNGKMTEFDLYNNLSGSRQNQATNANGEC